MDKLYCRFCGKSQDEVAKMLAFREGLAICDECVALMSDIIAEEDAKWRKRQLQSLSRTDSRKTPKELEPSKADKERLLEMATTREDIDLERLKAVVGRLLDEAIKRNGSNTFKLEHNFYWILDFTRQLDMSSQPAEMDVGSLCDDWELTQGIADVPPEVEVGCYSLTEVAQLLWYIGYRNVTPKGA